MINDIILDFNQDIDVYLTNKNPDIDAWSEKEEFIADLDAVEYDGMIEISVWIRSYRIYRWRNGIRIDDPGRKYMIKQN